MNNWQRAFVWTVGAVHIVGGVFIMMVIGAIAHGPPDPPHLKDALRGLVWALGLHGGLMSAPFLVTARPLYRVLTAATMLPAAWLHARGIEFFITGLSYGHMLLWTPGTILALTGSVAYAAQFYWLARGPGQMVYRPLHN